MAHATMATTNAAYIDGVQILYNSAYTARAITLDTAAFADGICKAGTPIAVDGKIANSNAAIGILLHDVYVERPQGTLVYYGTIRRDVAEAHCGLTYVDAMMAALKNVVFFKKEAAE